MFSYLTFEKNNLIFVDCLNSFSKFLLNKFRYSIIQIIFIYIYIYNIISIAIYHVCVIFFISIEFSKFLTLIIKIVLF